MQAMPTISLLHFGVRLKTTTMAATATLVSALSAVGRLPGPVFDKELRVASRQRRSYLLRFAYVALLTAFLVGAWFLYVRLGSQGWTIYQASRLGTAGRRMAATLIWFQFVAAQLAAVLLLSDAIHEEIRRRTLHVLAVTPITSLQIVLGKLAGGLLHVTMLLAISLPLLALVRVFGGVPWDYVLSGVCVTFTATVFIGALSLLASAFYGRPSVAALQALWYWAVLGRGIDALFAWLAHYYPAVGVVGKSVLPLINPTDVLLAHTQDMLAARPSTGLFAWWPLHSLILLAGAVGLLLLTARRVRRIAADVPSERTLKVGARESTRQAAQPGRRARGFLRRRVRVLGPIRRVEGSPVLWKELRNLTAFGSRRPWAVYGAPALIVCLIAALGIGIAVFVYGAEVSSVVTIMTGWALGIHVGTFLGFSMAAAKGISSEREARTLPVLLTAPLEDREIVRDKAKAVFRQGLLVQVPTSILFLLLLLLLAAVTKRIGPLTVVVGAGLYLAGLLGAVSFFIGLGLYCSARLRTTVAATGCMSLVFLGLVVLGLVVGTNLLRPIRMSGPEIWLTAFVPASLAALVGAGIGQGFVRAAARRLRHNVF